MEYKWNPITDEMREYRDGILHKHSGFPVSGQDVWITYDDNGTPTVIKAHLKQKRESDGDGFTYDWYDSIFRNVMLTSIKDKNVKAWMGIYEPAPYMEQEDTMELTRENAVKLHRKMWGDMRIALGNNPSSSDRAVYKQKWCTENFPNKKIINDCFLCEYAVRRDETAPCHYCPIDWGSGGCVTGNVSYDRSPISEILALPEREVTE